MEIYLSARHQLKPDISCGDGGVATKKGYVEILELLKRGVRLEECEAKHDVFINEYSDILYS